MGIIGVYQIKNLENNKIYIGSSKNIKTIWRQHKKQLNAGSHANMFLQEDWDIYGENAFEFSILETCEINERYELEQKYLNKLMPFDRTDNGYNINESAIIKNPTEYKFYSDGMLFGKRMRRIGSKVSYTVTAEDYATKTMQELINEYDAYETTEYLLEDYIQCNPDLAEW